MMRSEKSEVELKLVELKQVDDEQVDKEQGVEKKAVAIVESAAGVETEEGAEAVELAEPALTETELEEAARFRALTAARAARRAMIRRIMAEQEGLDEFSSAA